MVLLVATPFYCKWVSCAVGFSLRDICYSVSFSGGADYFVSLTKGEHHFVACVTAPLGSLEINFLALCLCFCKANTILPLR